MRTSSTPLTVFTAATIALLLWIGNLFMTNLDAHRYWFAGFDALLFLYNVRTLLNWLTLVIGERFEQQELERATIPEKVFSEPLQAHRESSQ